MPHSGDCVWANNLQVHGILLRQEDIGPTLVGRRAEMWWPADTQWYLIVVNAVDPLTNAASIMYTTGETEDNINLNEICREGHMQICTGETPW